VDPFLVDYMTIQTGVTTIATSLAFGDVWMKKNWEGKNKRSRSRREI